MIPEFLIVGSTSRRERKETALDEALPRRGAEQVTSWRSDNNAVGVRGWGYGRSGDNAHWTALPSGVAIFTGEPVATTGASLARTVEELFPQRRGPSVARRVQQLFSGIYSLAILGSDGSGFIATDPMALRFIYYGWDKKRFAVGSHADAVAHALAHRGARPRKDAESVCALAHNGLRPPGQSGFQGVSILEPGHVLALDARGSMRLVEQAPLWREPSEFDGRPLEDLCDLIFAELVASASRIDTIDAPLQADLTGGKDSRLVLALLLSTGLASELDFRTIGPPELPDVQVATTIARTFGLTHSSGLPKIDFTRAPIGEELPAFVQATGGIVHAGDSRSVPDQLSDDVRVSGLNGEYLRANQLLDPAKLSASPIDLASEAIPASRLGLATPDYARRLGEIFSRSFVAGATRSASPYDWLYDWHQRTHSRPRCGPLDDLQTVHRFLPLYTAVAVQITGAIGGAARSAELIHRYAMVRAAPELAAIGFGAEGWRVAALRSIQPELMTDVMKGLSLATPTPERSAQITTQQPSPPTPAAVTNKKKTSLFSALHANLPPARHDVYADIISDRNNEAWTLLDRNRVRQSLERYGELRPVERREFFGAISAAYWLAADR